MKIRLKCFYYPAAIGLSLAVSACGNSTVQKDSGTCEESGRVEVPANPETGAKSYCAKGSLEQVCNLRDLKLDPATRECVAVTDDDVRMLYLDDRSSALRRLDAPVLSLCLAGPAYSRLSHDVQSSFKEKLLRGANLWLAPLAELGLPDLASRLAIIEPTGSCPSDAFASIRIVDDTFPDCKADRRACVQYEISTINFRSADGLTDEVVVHEFGHIFGMDDLYVDKELRPEDPADLVTGCLKGFFGSTMCHERPSLGPADIVGIKNMYCAVTGNENCKKPRTWNQAYFGHSLGSCWPVDYKESDVSFHLAYDRGRALNNETPYSGNLYYSEIANDQVVMKGEAVEVVGKSGLEPSSDVFSTLEIAPKDGGSSLIWDIKDSKLSGNPVNCSLNQWLNKS